MMRLTTVGGFFRQLDLRPGQPLDFFPSKSGAQLIEDSRVVNYRDDSKGERND